MSILRVIKIIFHMHRYWINRKYFFSLLNTMKAIQVKIICNIWVKSRYIWLSKRNHDHSRIWFIHNYSDDFFYLLYTFPSFCRKLTTSRTPAALKSRHDTTLSAQLQERSFRNAAYINKDSRTNPPISLKRYPN